jgi:hypothetical protein
MRPISLMFADEPFSAISIHCDQRWAMVANQPFCYKRIAGMAELWERPAQLTVSAV